MGEPMTVARRAQLEAAMRAGDRQAYYKLLADWKYDYGRLALGFVNYDGISGVTANAYARSVALSNGKTITDAEWADFSVYLMRLDFDARMRLGVGSTSDLDFRDQTRNHLLAFRNKLGLPIMAWTAYAPIEIARLQGGSAAAQAMWQRMLQGDGYWGELGGGGTISAYVARFNPEAASYEAAKFLPPGPARDSAYLAATSADLLERLLTGLDTAQERLAAIWLNHTLSPRVVAAIALESGQKLLETGRDVVRDLTGISYTDGSAQLQPAVYFTPLGSERPFGSRAVTFYELELLIPDDEGNIIGISRGHYDVLGVWRERERNITLYKYDEDGHLVRDADGKAIRVGTLVTTDKITVETGYVPGTDRVISSNVKIDNNPVGLEFSDVASALGQKLGSYLAGSNRLAGVVTSSVLGTIAADVGDVLDGLIKGGSLENAIDSAFADFDSVLLANLKSAGIGALSSFLTAELVKGLGIDGFAGELANTAGGAVLQQIISQLGSANPLAGVASMATLGTAVGSFLGAKLASTIVSFDTVGGQLGSAIGSSLGVLAAGKLLGIGGALGGPIGAAIGAFAGFIVGGLVGSLFGGTPRSGADVVWNAATQRFDIANAYSRKGGSKDAAIGMASAVASNFNAVLAATGGRLLDPAAVQAGNYGMRKKDFVYRATSTTDVDAISARFGGKNGAADLINHGTYQGLADADFRIVGGDVYVKRAVYATIERTGAAGFEVQTLLGNIATAQRYQQYLLNAGVVGGLIGSQSDSAFAAEWVVTLTQAVELGLGRRHAADWYGGFTALLAELGGNAGNVAFGVDYGLTGRPSRLFSVNGTTLSDTIDTAGQDIVVAGDGNDIIDARGIDLAAATGGVNIGLTLNGAAFAGAVHRISVALAIDAGAGDDIVHASDRGDNVFGGAGSDTLYGGRLDDWLIGGDGDDRLQAGDAAGGLGGDGNYLDGGAGDDVLEGAEGSDWLEGGEGVDKLRGGDGDDVLAGGAGDGDRMWGGGGSDQYLVRFGDGADMAFEAAPGYAAGGQSSGGKTPAPAPDDVNRPSTQPPTQPIPEEDVFYAGEAQQRPVDDDEMYVPDDGGPGSGSGMMAYEVDAIAERMAAIASGRLAADWAGRSAGVTNGVIDGGEDAVVFGRGIGLGDIRLERSGSREAPGGDLVVTVFETVNGAQRVSASLTLSEWFTDPFKRVEWLRFADGNAIKLSDITSFVIGGAGNDLLIGTAGNDFIWGGAGNDSIRALAGNDIALGGAGDDLVSGDADNDVVVGGLGNDQVLGGAGNDALTGDEGRDDVYGGDGADIVSGGLGDGDTVVGGKGDDRFKYTRGDGRDTIFDDYVDAGWTVVISNGVYQPGYAVDAAGSVLFTGPDGRTEIVAFNRTGNPANLDLDWRGRFDWNADTGTLRRFAAPANGSMVQDAGTDTLEFAPGIDIQDIVLRRVGNDLLLAVGDDDAESVDARALADGVTIKDWYVTGGGGQIEKLAFYQTGVLDIEAVVGGVPTIVRNLVAATDGNDGTDAAPLSGSAINDWITAGAGDDVVAGGAGDDIIAGNSGRDSLRGDAGKDVLYGGTGDDTLDGGADADVLIGGTGFDIAGYASAAGPVTVHLSAPSANTGDAAGDSFVGIEGLLGGAGDDTLGGDEGQNQLEGGAGSDALWGGAGDDTYVWAIGHGADTIRDAAFTVVDGVAQFDGAIDAGNDVLELGAGLSLTDFAFAWADGDLLLMKDGGTTQQIRLQGQASANGRVETLQFADGLAVALTGVLVAGGDGVATGTTGDDLLVGRWGGFADQLAGGAGNDALVGHAGDDQLSGGDGDDVLEGGAGADRLDGGANGAGTATAGDTARYAGSLAAVTVNLTLASAQGGGGDAKGDVLVGIENLVGSAFNDTLTGDAGANRIAGLAGVDRIYGGAGDDVLMGDDGNDRLYGEAGDDALAGGTGDDLLQGGDGNDRLDGGEGNDQMIGGAGADVLTGGAGDDIFQGEAGDNTLLGGDGNDLIFGGNDHDLIEGGAGNDDLNGGDGNDRYVFGADDGADRLLDGWGVNTLVFDETVAPERLWLTRSGNDLRVAVIGGTTDVTLRDFFTGGTRLRSVQTTGHAYYLDNADSLALVAAMTAAGAVPAAMPASIAALLPSYWHVGGKAKPTAPAAVRTYAIAEDGTLSLPGDWGVVDHDGGALTFRIGAGAALGEIGGFDPATGAFTYTARAQASGVDQFSLIATDADGQAVEIRLAITIQSSNDAPGPITVVGGGTLSVAEAGYRSDTTAGLLIGQVTATDPEGDALSYRLVDDAGGRFRIGEDGRVSVGDAALLDHEVSASHRIVVEASDAKGGTSRSELTVAVTNVNEANALPGRDLTINEGTGAGAIIATLAATDSDAASHAFGQQRYYFWSADAVGGVSFDGRYAIDAVTGAITTRTALTAEAGGTPVTYRVVARDNAGAAPFNEAFADVRIKVADVNDPTGLPATHSFAVNEGIAIGTPVFRIVATDPDAPENEFGHQRYYFRDAGGAVGGVSADGRFAIDAETGVITSVAPLDYETGTRIASYTVVARDNGGKPGYSEARTTVTVRLDDVNDANSLPAEWAPMTVAENRAVGTAVGRVTASDPDLAGEVTGRQRYYFLDGESVSARSADGRYAIDASTGAITTAAVLDREAAASGTYTVVARDLDGGAGHHQARTSVRIDVADVNEPNNLPATVAMRVAENSAPDTTVGTVRAGDTDRADTKFGEQRYYFWDGATASAISADGRYAIHAGTGTIRAVGVIDYEAAASGTYRVIARDNAGEAPYHQAETLVTIDVDDRNEANSLATPPAASLAENAGIGALVAQLRATDLDRDGVFGFQRYFFWEDGLASTISRDGRYLIDEMLGQVTLAAPLDYEAGATEATYQVIARDNDGAAGYNQAEATLSVTIRDVNEAPTAMSWGGISVVERDRVAAGAADASRPQVALASFAVADPDTAGTAFATYRFAVADDRFEFVGNSLRLKAGASLDYEAASSFTVDVTATDSSGNGALSITRAVTIAVTDRDDVYEGTGGNDTATGQAGRDLMYGFGGNDTLAGGAGDDLLDGGGGDDVLAGGVGNDALHGREGEDRLQGGDGNDALYGGGNDAGRFDRLFGDAGDDALYGEDGDDYLIGGAGADLLDGGAGIDVADYRMTADGVAAVTGVTADLADMRNNTGVAAGDRYVGVENLIGTDHDDTLRGDAGANVLQGGGGNDGLEGNDGDDRLYGEAGNDRLWGGNGADLLEGGDGNDTLYGGAGNDVLRGGAGDDTLFAEDGDDMLDGGAGNDTLNGGLHNDTYLMSRTSGADTINNFDAEGTDVDVIGLQDAAGAIEDRDLWFERSGNDMIVSVIGTASSARVVNWYVMSGIDRSNYKIDFIVAGERYNRTIDVEGLVGLMGGRAKPADAAARDALMADAAYRRQWENYWTNNRKPVIGAIADQTVNEDGTITLTFRATDDVTPANGLTIAAEVLAGGALVPVQNVSWSNADAAGYRTLTIVPTSQMAGTATVRLVATDAGGLRSEPRDFTVTVNAVADAPVIHGFGGTSGNAGTTLPLSVNVAFADNDGSEVHELWITGVPAGVTLSAGSYDGASGTWKLTRAQTAGLGVTTPAGWSRDLALTLTARASEGGQTATATATTTMVINAGPTDTRLGGFGLAGPSVAESAPGSNPAGAAVGVVAPVDPDALERSRITTDFNAMPLRRTGEERVITAAGPNGVGNVQVLETGQFNGNGDEPGGGVFDIGAGAIDAGKVYKYTIYVKPENGLAHHLYWGTRGNVENAETGAADTNPYFWYGQGTGLVRDRWYRIEGYVLPSGSALVQQGLFGGVYDTVTGEKVANTTTFRFAPGAQDTGGRFFSYYDQNSAGYSAQWYQPQIEQQDFAYALTDDAGGRFTIDPVTGLIRANGTAFDHEAARSHNVTVRVTDGGGLQLSQVKTIAVANVNEAPNQPSGGGDVYFDETGLGARPANAGVAIGSYSLTDPDGTTPSLVFGSNPNDWFVIDGGSVRFRSGLDFNFEWARSAGYNVGDFNGDGRLDAHVANVVVHASDGSLTSAGTTTRVFISDVNEAPYYTAGGGLRFFDETGLGANPANNGVAVTTFAAVDPDGTSPSFQLLTNPGGWFRLDGATLRFTGANLDYEWFRNNNYGIADRDGDGRLEAHIADVVVRMSDGVHSFDRLTQVVISDTNERPNDLVLEASNIFTETTGSESHAGALLARFGVTDPDASGARLVILGGNDYGWFQVNGGHIQVTGANWTADWLRNTRGTHGQDAGFYYDHDGDGMMEIRIATLTLAAEDASGLRSNPFTYNVFIENKNEAPAAPTNGGWKFFDETNLGGNPANGGVVVSTMGLSDPDGTAPTLQLVTNPNNWFYIDGNQIKFTGGFNHDFETFRNSGAYGIHDWNGDGRLEAHIANVYVRATDGALNSPDTLVQVFVSDVNERPNNLVMEANNVFAETIGGDSHAWRYQTRFGLSDPDGPAPSLVILSGNENGWFQVNGGHIQVTGANWTADWIRGNKGRYGTNAENSFDTNGNGLLEARVATLTVAARDASGAQSDPFTYSIFIEDQNEAPTLALEASNVFRETGDGNSHAGLLQARFGIADPDGGARLEIVGGNGNNWFRVADDGRHIQVTGANWTADWFRATLNQYGQDDFRHDSNGNGIAEIKVASLQVRANDDRGGVSGVYTHNIFIEERNEQNALGNAWFGVDENVGHGTVVGRMTATDADIWAPFRDQRYYFWDGSNISNQSYDGRFTIDAVSGEIRTNAGIDYEATHGFAYTVTARDFAGNPGYTQSFARVDIGVRNLNDNGTTATATNGRVVENSLQPGEAIAGAKVNAYDADGLPLTYWLDANWNPGGIFQIDGNGQIKLGHGGIDYEASWWTAGGPTGKYYDLLAYVNDGGATFGVNVRIEVENRVKYLWNNSSLTPGYQPRNRSTNMSEYYGNEPYYGGGYDDPTYMRPYGQEQWLNEWWLEGPEGVVGYYSEMSQWQGTTRNRPESSANYADGYVTVGDWRNWTVYSDDENNQNTVGYYGGYPIALDLGGDGLDIRGVFAGDVFYDRDGDGRRDRTAWVGAGDALLALDRDGDGRIARTDEISFVGDKPGAKTDLEGLAGFDDNGDGVLDAADRRFADFRVWQDANGDGVSQAGELRSLAEAGITALSLVGTPTGDRYAGGDATTLATASFTLADGTSRTLHDLVLGYRSAGGGATPAAAAVPADPRLDRMVQAMSGFGASPAASLDRLHRADAAGFDFFAGVSA